MEVKLKIGQKISALRRARGHTQEQLAEHLGVTKASVSKWETMQSCPDISILPRLAAYFGVSIDELVGYEAQLSAREMKELYERLIRRFSEEGFEAGMAPRFENFVIKGNDFFDLIDTWLAENLVTPREQRLVMESFREQVGSNPIFLSYLGEDGSAPEEYKARFAKIREVLENA